MFDIVFISYNELNAEENWQRLIERFPTAQRVHGVKGIHQAHIAAAKKCWTKMFWVVDGDAVIKDDFDLSYKAPIWDQETVHVWSSENPINNLVYGYGGVKLLPTQLTRQIDISSSDMTTSISDKFKIMPVVSNITEFNTDEFTTWRSAFRECAKLASKTIQGQKDEETEQRLETWCEVGHNSRFGEFCIRGARSGRDFGYDNINSPNNLKLINDFDWLYAQFREA